MKYTLLEPKVVERICDAFYGHSDYINDKYNAISKGDTSYSDRDRFVKKFFSKHIGKHIVLSDKEITGYAEENFVYTVDCTSVYSSRNKSNMYNRGKPLYRHVKKFLAVRGFHAINEMYGSGYIEMDCWDVFGNPFSIRLDSYTLRNIQFREITEQVYNSVASLFTDDRDDIPFNVTRFLDYEEIKEKHLTRSKTLPQETVSVMAKDADEAMAKVRNAISVTIG
jgi:hypothetical protein